MKLKLIEAIICIVMEDKEKGLDDSTCEKSTQNICSSDEDTSTVLSFTQNISTSEILSSTPSDTIITHEQHMKKKMDNTKIVDERKEIEENKLEKENERKEEKIEVKKNTTILKKESGNVLTENKDKQKKEYVLNVEESESESEKEKDKRIERPTFRSFAEPQLKKEKSRVKKVINWTIEGECRTLDGIVDYLQRMKNETDVILSSYVWHSHDSMFLVKIFIKFLKVKELNFFTFIPLRKTYIDHAGKGYVQEREEVEYFGRPLYKYFKGLEYNYFVTDEDSEVEEKADERLFPYLAKKAKETSSATEKRKDAPRKKRITEESEGSEKEIEKRKRHERDDEDSDLISSIYKLLQKYEGKKRKN